MSAAPSAEVVAQLAAAYRLAASGRAVDAERALRDLIAAEPACVPARDDLCALLLAGGRAAEAEAEARGSLALAPEGPDALNHLASALLRQRRAADAVPLLRAVLRLRPDFVEACHNLFLACVATGDPDGALAALRRAVELLPDDPEYLGALSALQRDRGWPDEALALAERAFALAPRSLAARITLARATRLAGDLPRAIALLREAPEHATAPLLAATLAQLEWEAGDMDAAIAAAERALALDPRNTAARVTIAQARRATARDDANLLALETALDDPALAQPERVRCLEAVGKSREDLGEHAVAFARHAAAKALRRDLAPRYDHAQTLAFEAACRELCADGTFVRLAAHGSPDERPVFVVGMPRSGTSLVEQIAAAHPAVHGCGELLELSNAARRLHDAALAQGRDGFPRALRDQTGDRIAALAQSQLAGLVARAGSDAARIVDKMPQNLRLVGLIHALFPRARIVRCRRDPLDTCASIFFQVFGRGHEYAYDLADLARYYAASERLAALWRAELPLALHEVVYEDLVAEPERVSRELIAFLGLEWDARCAKPHELARPVRTASAWQVRQPINRASVGRWRRYGDALAPLIETLRAEGVEVEG